MAPLRSSTLTLLAAYLGLVLGLVDSNAVNLALPAISTDLGGAGTLFGSGGGVHELTGAGREFLTDLGVVLPTSGRPLIRYCVDWTEQRGHGDRRRSDGAGRILRHRLVGLKRLFGPGPHGVQISRSSMPLFMVTVVGAGPVTSKWIFPVAVAPCGMVAPLMLTGLATIHSTR